MKWMARIFMVFVIALMPIVALANSNGFTLRPMVSEKVLSYETEYDMQYRLDSGCSIDVTGAAGETFTVGCRISTDAHIQECAFSKDNFEKITYKTLIFDEHESKATVTITETFGANDNLFWKCSVISDENPPDKYVNFVTVDANGFTITRDSVPVVSDLDFYARTYLPLVTRAWGG